MKRFHRAATASAIVPNMAPNLPSAENSPCTTTTTTTARPIYSPTLASSRPIYLSLLLSLLLSRTELGPLPPKRNTNLLSRGARTTRVQLSVVRTAEPPTHGFPRCSAVRELP